MSVINVEVEPKPYESFEKLIRRFVKKCKKEEVAKTFCEKSRHKTKRQKTKEKREKNDRLRRKHERF